MKVPRSQPPNTRALLPGALILLLVVASVVTSSVPGTGGEAIGVIAMVVGHGTAAYFMFRRSRDLPGHERHPWQVMSLALAMAATGLLVVVGLGADAPVFGVADLFFVMAYFFMVVALALLARMDSGGHPWGLTMLDVAVGAVAATAIVWSVVLEDLTRVEVTTFERFGLSLYPILDVAIIVGLCLVTMRRSHYRFDLRILLIAAGMSVQVAADLLFLREGVQAVSVADAQPRLWLFLLASALFVGAATIVRQQPLKQEFPDRDAPMWAIIWPYLLAAILIPLHVQRVERLIEGSSTARDATGERVILYALLAVGVLIVARQWVAIRYNRERIERQRRDLISSVSHELRTPLTAVVGFLHVLEQEPGAFNDSEKDSMMQEVSHQAKHMSRTVTDLITLARDGGATMMIRSGEASLAQIVESASGEAFGGSFTADVDDHDLWVDADRLDQAIGHLLANAGKYGGERTHLRAGVRGGTLTVEVHDDGPGLPTKHITSVWNQFDRGTRRLDSTNPGLGIGLAIVRAVAVAHGGTATYRQSELLGGACFSIVIPANAPSGAPWVRELSGRAIDQGATR